MECQEVLERISPFIDDVLDRDTTQAMKDHFAQCASCARELQAKMRLLQVAHSIKPADPPNGLAQAIRSAITALETEQKRCADMLPLISAYVDGELPADQARNLEAHASQCENCRKDIRVIRILTNATSTVEPVEPPADLRSRISAAVAETYRTISVWSRLTSNLAGWLNSRAAKIAYATAVTAGIVVFFIQFNAPTERATVSTIQSNRHATVAQTTQSTNKITPQKQTQTHITAEAQSEPAQNVFARRMQPRTKLLRKFSSDRALALAPTKRFSKHSSESIETKLTLPDSADSAGKDQTDSTELAGTTNDAKSEAVVTASVTEDELSSQADKKVSDKNSEVMVAAAPFIEPEKTQEMIREIKAQASVRRHSEQTVSIAILRSRF
ncbi:MAG: anti-sigma factor family protein [Armatimonadota bacterium]